MGSMIHETAIVDAGANIGSEVKIWHFSHVCSGAVIGNNVSLGQNVFIGNNVKIGNDCKIQNNVSVFDSVTLEDGVFCGPSVVFTNVINPRARINRKNEYRDTVIRSGASLGANCTIICGVTIGKYAMIGAGSIVTRDVADFALMVGGPARQIGWIDEEGNKINIPLSGRKIVQNPHTKAVYELNGETLTRAG